MDKLSNLKMPCFERCLKGSLSLCPKDEEWFPVQVFASFSTSQRLMKRALALRVLFNIRRAKETKDGGSDKRERGAQVVGKMLEKGEISNG